MREMLAEIDAPSFNCGIVLQDDKVVRTAPIVYWMKGWTREKVRNYCKLMRYKVKVIWEMDRVQAIDMRQEWLKVFEILENSQR
jgi:hypothetical protein